MIYLDIFPLILFLSLAAMLPLLIIAVNKITERERVISPLGKIQLPSVQSVKTGPVIALNSNEKITELELELSIARELQRKFIPLNTDTGGNRLNYGSEETDFCSFFVYYKGAKEMSGDFIDYKDLDGRHYAIIKCDIAGKGISAAFIMAQIAAMFRIFFKNWKYGDDEYTINKFVYKVNNYIEELSFESRFAAFTICLLDSHTGNLEVSSAGDNILHIYSESGRRLKSIFLSDSPAAGILPIEMIEKAGGYKVRKLNMEKGDMLIMYTDGIDEAKRRFRDSNFSLSPCCEGEIDSPHGNHYSGQADEEIGHERVDEIINAVMKKRKYTLYKWHNPEGDNKELYFDFRSSNSSTEDVILALISIEKMFRCYKDPGAGMENTVQVDRTLDGFLKKYFVQYDEYCSSARDLSKNSKYIEYCCLSEDEQYDDLTILGIMRK